MKQRLRTRHPAWRVTLLASALAALAAHSLAWGAWSTTVAPVATAPASAEEEDEAGVAEIPEVTEPTGHAEPEAPCPDLDGETPSEIYGMVLSAVEKRLAS